MSQDDEDKQWDLYCSVIANPLADDVGSFEEFKQKFVKIEQSEPTLNNSEIKLQVEKANKILNEFVPPTEEGR